MKKEGQIRIPSGCAIAAVISKEGNRMSGEMIIDSMKPMHERSNGLGGGFTGYGIYPQYKDFYAFHMFYDCRTTRKKCESFLKEHFEIIHSELIPTCKIPTITPRKGSCCVKMYSKTVWCSIRKVSGSPRRTNFGSG